MQKMLDALLINAAANPGEIAIRDDAGILSRGELFAAVAHMAKAMEGKPSVIGILAGNGREWAVAQLAGMVAGKTIVPLPLFFSPAQIGNVVRDASVELILHADGRDMLAQGMGIALEPLRLEKASEPSFSPRQGFSQIIYTSGSTGSPKGVRHGAAQMLASAEMLIAATGSTGADRYLSVLPLPMLLETISAVLIPTLLGASVVFDGQVADAVGNGDASSMSAVFDRCRPTVSVLVPQLLRAWVGQLQAAGRKAPDSLRMAAVGGAPLPPAVADAAWALGIPAHEGYGLSECCSVVSLNRPGERRNGTVGRPLDGISVTIDQGEIVVDSPTIMDGYLGMGKASSPWRTGDLGSIDADGYLIIEGRKDNLIVNTFGRNISPEWVETMLIADPRIAVAAVAGHGAATLTAVLIPSVHGDAWFRQAGREDVLNLIEETCRSLPAYAVPRDYRIILPRDAMLSGLLTKAGRVARPVLQNLLRPADKAAAPDAA
jgi:long-subunit acyl-CoA synthetase (AMP-forming)